MSNPFNILELLTSEVHKRTQLLNVHTWNRAELEMQGKVIEMLHNKWKENEYEMTSSCNDFHLAYHTARDLTNTINELFNSCRWFVCGLNSTWSVEAWCYTFRLHEVESKDGLFYVVDHEDGTYGIVRRWLSREENEVEPILDGFTHLATAMRTLEQRYEELVGTGDERKQAKQPTKENK